jgi:hypothetical protein
MPHDRTLPLHPGAADAPPSTNPEPLYAGTLALLTCLVERLDMAPAAGTVPDGPPLPALRRKVEANLALLTAHPALSEPMRAVAARLIARWQCMAESGDARGSASCPTPTAPAFDDPSPDTRRWH